MSAHPESPLPFAVTPPAVSTFPIDRARSLALARVVRAQNWHCYRNAYYAAMHVTGAMYVEGYAVCLHRGHVTRHGWLQSGERIIDVTPTYHKASTRSLYVPAIRSTWHAMHHEIAVQGGAAVMPFLFRYEAQMATGTLEERALAARVLDAERLGLVAALEASVAHTGTARLLAA